MRRLVALLILIVIPLQWTYAAVADYCEHEAAPAAQQHVGHHAHEHVDDPGRPDSDVPTDGSRDADCPACHHAAGGALPGVLDTSFASEGLRVVASASREVRHRDPDTPFRPPLSAGL